MPVFDWKTDDFTPKINTFDCASSGSNNENVGTREVDFFKIFMSNTLMSYICDETNKQYQYVKSNCNEFVLEAKIIDWHNNWGTIHFFGFVSLDGLQFEK